MLIRESEVSLDLRVGASDVLHQVATSAPTYGVTTNWARSNR